MITITMLEYSLGKMLMDLTPFAQGLKFSSGKHGFAAASWFMPRNIVDSFYIFDRPGTPHIVIGWNGITLWEGRLEDVAVVAGGLRLKAFGYWRALMDLPYTGLWEKTTVDGFRPVTTDEISTRKPDMHCFNFTNQIFIGLEHDATYTNLDDIGDVIYQSPDQGGRDLVRISFDYEVLLPNNWAVRGAVSDGLTAVADIWTHAATGVLQTGSQNIDFSATPGDSIRFRIVNNTGGNHNYTGESGDNYLKITNIKIWSVDASAFNASTMVSSLVATHTAAVNAWQISSETGLIDSTGLELHNEIYEDKLPSEIIDYLALLGDGTNQFEACVWENQILAFRQKGSQGRNWYVDIAAPDIERTIEILRNSAYAVYQEPSGRTLRTATSTDDFSWDRYTLIRREAVRTNTTDQTEAENARDTFISDHKSPKPRAAIAIKRLFDKNGGLWPSFFARYSDTITIRNLPPSLATEIDRIRTFMLAETEYFVDTRTLAVVPETPLPTLDLLLARKSAGVVATP